MKGIWILTVLLTALIFQEIGSTAQRGGHWELLGEQEVDFQKDHDRIHVKKRAGPYRQLRVEVRNAPIEIYEMVVTFGDRKKFRPQIHSLFHEGSGSQVIDLPGNQRRSLDGVEFVYRSVRSRAGKGRLFLYGR